VSNDIFDELHKYLYFFEEKKMKNFFLNSIWPSVELLNLEVHAMLFSLSMMKMLLKGL